MAEELGFVGEEYDLLIRQGQTFALEVVVQKPDATPYNLTGYTVESHIRRRARDLEPMLEFSAELTDAAAGEFTLTLTATQTAGMSCGDTLYDASSIYNYDVEVQLGDVVLPVMWGKLRIHREVTRG